MGPTRISMSLLPYTSPYARYGYGYGYGAHAPAAYGAYGGYGPCFYGAGYPYGPYGMTAEEIQKVREAEEKPSTMPKPSARSSWRRRKRSTRSLLLLRRRSMRTMCLPKRRLSRMPSQRRRSSQKSLDHTPMAHMAQQALSVDTATATAILATMVRTHMAMEHMAAHTTRRMLTCNALCR